jgi:hypothetical protein
MLDLYHNVLLFYFVFFAFMIFFSYFQIYQWLGKLHFSGSWRKGRIGKPDLSQSNDENLKVFDCLIFVNRIKV